MNERSNLCFNVNLSHYMHNYGLKKSSLWLFCALGELGFQYDNNYMMGMSGDFSVLLKRFIGLFDNLINTELIDSKAIFSKIARRKPAIVLVDNYFIESTIFYLKEHHHTVMLLFEINRVYAQIYDNGYKVIPTDIFLNAAMQENRIICLFCSELKLKYSDYSIVLKGFESCAESLGNFESMRKYIADLKKNKNSKYQFDQYLAIKRPGGLYLTRRDMSNFLLEYNHIKFAELYYQLSEKWRVVGNLIFKLSVRNDDDLRERISKMLYDIVCSEQLYFYELNEYFKNKGEYNEKQIGLV